MSDISGDGQGSGTATPPSSDQGSPTTPPSPSPQGQEGGSSDYSLASGFLQQVAEDDRPIVEKYIKDWDAGVTQRFQQIHSQLGWAQDYVDQGLTPDDIRGAVGMWNLLDENPKLVYNILKEQLSDMLDPESSEQGPQGNQQSEWLSQLPPEMQQQWLQQQEQMSQHQKALEAMAEFVLQQQHQSQEAQEDAQLDQLLSMMQSQYGDFDEEYVLTKMANGRTPEQAVQDYQQLVSQLLGQQDRNGQGPGAGAPPVVGGTSIPISDGFDVKKADSKDIKALVAKMTAEAVKAEG